MSKKHRQQNYSASNGQSQSGTGSHALEYRIIKHDLIRVIILNILYLAGILAIYFSDQKTHFLQHWFNRILHF